MLIGTVAGAGPVRQVIHPPRLNARGAGGWLIAWLIPPAVVGVIALVAGTGALVPFLIMLAAATAGLAVPFRVVTGMRIQICEQGLIIAAPLAHPCGRPPRDIPADPQRW